MGKSRRGNKEYTREQRLIQENKKLKREISGLRKQMARIDLDRYHNIRDIIEKHYREEKEQEGIEILEHLKKEWACHEGGCKGYLEIILYNKVDTTWYFRRCNICRQRTESKQYSPSVRGIISETNKLAD